MVLTKMQSAIVDLINSMPLGAGKSHLVAYLYVNDENAKSIVEDWAARLDNKESPENSPASPAQQLKAEIAAIVERLQRAYAMRESPDVLDCISKLRQLSAV